MHLNYRSIARHMGDKTPLTQNMVLIIISLPSVA